MKIINLIIILTLIIFSSCNKDKQNIDILNNNLKKKELINDSLVAVLKLKEKETISLKKENEFLSTLSGNFLQYFPNKTALFEYAFNDLKKDTIVADYLVGFEGELKLFYRDASFELEDYNFGFKSYNKKKAFAYIFKTMRRDPEFIENLLSNKEKKQLFQTIKSSEWYKKSDLDKFVKTLLLSYEDLERKNINEDVYDSIRNPYYNIWNVAGEEIEDLLTFTNEYGTFCSGGTIKYSYLFWLRRRIEGNQKVVYNLLNEFEEFVIEK